ncbi:tetraspanin-2 [Silurus asotus]|uniref:Tetraspanin n=1 Tax=Silurus asotus TaxID=30991 RepID=A0AAD5FTW0_SILAS|nr:tetraspanin-2 [Silurus asotus]
MGKVQGATKCVKYLLFFFNFIFWLSGSVVLAVALWLRFDPSTTSLLENGAPETLFFAVYILVGAGVIIMLVGFFGCCGAVRESKCLLGLFFSCLLIIFGAQLAAGVFGLLNKDKIVEEVKSFYNERGNDTVTNLYRQILCCGGSEESTENTLCSDGNTKDCLKAIEDFFNEKLSIIGYVGVGIAGIMIIGMIFSMILCCGIRKNREVI